MEIALDGDEIRTIRTANRPDVSVDIRKILNEQAYERLTVVKRDGEIVKYERGYRATRIAEGHQRRRKLLAD